MKRIIGWAMIAALFCIPLAAIVIEFGWQALVILGGAIALFAWIFVAAWLVAS